MKKKIILGSIIAILVIAIIVLTIVLVNMLNDKSTKKEKSKYQVMAEEFVDAIKSEKALQEFLKKYCDYKALYAYDSATTINPEDMDEFVELFETSYKDADEEDIEDVRDRWDGGLFQYVDLDLDLTLKKVEKEYIYPDFPDMIDVPVRYKNADGKDVNVAFALYKDKLIYISFEYGLLPGEDEDFEYEEE